MRQNQYHKSDKAVLPGDASLWDWTNCTLRRDATIRLGHPQGQGPNQGTIARPSCYLCLCAEALERTRYSGGEERRGIPPRFTQQQVPNDKWALFSSRLTRGRKSRTIPGDTGITLVVAEEVLLWHPDDRGSQRLLSHT